MEPFRADALELRGTLSDGRSVRCVPDRSGRLSSDSDEIARPLHAWVNVTVVRQFATEPSILMPEPACS